MQEGDEYGVDCGLADIVSVSDKRLLIHDRDIGHVICFSVERSMRNRREE